MPGLTPTDARRHLEMIPGPGLVLSYEDYLAIRVPGPGLVLSYEDYLAIRVVLAELDRLRRQNPDPPAPNGDLFGADTQDTKALKR